MLLSKKVVLVALTCCVAVVSAADPRLVLGGSGVHLGRQIVGGSSGGGHGGISSTGGAGGRSYSGNKGFSGRPARNVGAGVSYTGNGDDVSHFDNGGSYGPRAANDVGGDGSHSGNGDGGGHSIGRRDGGITRATYGSGVSAGQYGGYKEESQPPKPYNFSYAVKDSHAGVNFGHSEQSDGETVRGQYHVLLPDGRTQVVTYTANWRTGYKADVQYIGEASYPQLNSNSGVGWASSGNGESSAGNRETFVGNDGSYPTNQISSGNGPYSTEHGQPLGSNGGYSKSPSSGYGPVPQSPGYVK